MASPKGEDSSEHDNLPQRLGRFKNIEPPIEPIW